MSTITKDLGAVTAYAYAKEKGYTGTEAEFAELMASYATVAEQASQSAQTATEKAQQASASATSASQSADTASASATSAQTAQQTATAKASEAQQSATTATTKAQEASQSASESSQSASTAVQAKTDAESAKTASETAQGLAEQARNEAVSAKTGAESARDEAQDIVDGITNKVEQIDSNTERTESLEDDRYKPYAVDTASGAVATFTDGADDIPMKSVKVAIEPVQSGSGDPSPDNVRPISGWTGAQVVRTGVNVWDEEWESGSINATTGEDEPSNSIIRCAGYTKVFPNTTYYISTQESAVVFFYDAEKNYINASTRQNQTFTTPSNTAFIRFRMSYSYGTIYNHDISINYPSTDHDSHPYVGSTYPITFPSEAGTVYGGTLDVTNGVLTVDRASIASYNGETLPSEWISDRDKYVAGTAPTTGAQVVYKLATPITYHLTPTEIKSLLGDNNVWADAGDTEVTYRADTKLYINRKIAEAISALS